MIPPPPPGAVGVDMGSLFGVPGAPPSEGGGSPFGLPSLPKLPSLPPPPPPPAPKPRAQSLDELIQV